MDSSAPITRHGPRSLETARPRAVLVRLALWVILLAAIASCGGPTNEIAGKWRAAGDASAMIWEFSQDGSVKIGSTEGRYSFGDRGRVKIETRSGTSVYEMELSGDRMTLKDPRGSRIELTKVR